MVWLACSNRLVAPDSSGKESVRDPPSAEPASAPRPADVIG